MDLNINFKKSPQDKNTYKVIKLDNQLDCLLVHDPEADKSSAAMCIDIGDCDDPETRPGMAHFLEHMLFMGTKKFPEQNDYDSYLTANSGSNNAYTAGDVTNYFLECSNEAFEGALDRFSQFFIAPLLENSCVDRELNAVNSENEIYINNDFWREYHLFRMSGAKGNPYSKFCVGNLKSLQAPTIREEVSKFYEDTYSANNMKLVVYSKSDIATLESWVKQYFIEVPNKNYTRRVFDKMPFTKENMGNFYKLVPIKDNDYLDFIWIFENAHKNYKNNPVKYLTHLFGHEGENSLLSLLKEEGLATALTVESEVEMDLFTTLKVRVKLTQAGYETYKDVAGYVFQYMNMVKSYGAQKWIFEEIQKSKNMKFRFVEKSEPIDVVYRLSADMTHYPYEDILKLNYFMDNFDEELFNKTIQGLTLENLRIVLVSKKVESECDQTEEWYQVKHTVKPFEQYIVDNYNGKGLPTPKVSKKKLDLPPKNIFLPENFDVFYKAEDKNSDEPTKIRDDTFSEVWFKKDSKFFVPKAQINSHLYFKDGSFGNSVDTYVLSKLWVKLFNYHTQEMTYLAQEANVELNFDLHAQGYALEVKGYSDTILTVVSKFFEKIIDFKPEQLEAIFKNIHYDELQEAKNFIKGTSYLIGQSLVESFIQTGNNYHVEKRIEALNHLGFQDLIAFHKIILRNIKLLWFFTGNLKEQDVTTTVSHIEEILTKKREGVSCTGLTKFEIPDIRVVQIPDDSTWIYEFNLKKDNPTEPANPNSAIYNVFQLKEHNDQTRILNNILFNYLIEKFFNQLRTVEQLGYVTRSRAGLWRGVNFFYFGIQSDVKWPYYLRQRISAFLENIKTKVEELSDEEFKKFVESVKTDYLQKDLKLGDEADRHWEEIRTQQYYFNRKLKYAEQIVSIPKKDFQEHVQNIFFNAPRKFEVHVVSELMKDENEKLKAEVTENVRYVTSEDAFKKKLALYPDFFAISKQ